MRRYLALFLLLATLGAVIYFAYPHEPSNEISLKESAACLGCEPPEEVAYARSQLNLSGPTDQKITDIVAYLYRTIDPHVGISKRGLTHLQTLHQLQEGAIGTGRENITRAYVGLANAMGIPSRLVEVRCQCGSCLVAESWVEEEDSWAFVDPASRCAYVKTDHLLSTKELSQTKRPLTIALFEGNRIVERQCEISSLSIFNSGHTIRYPSR